jgi:hypothetical protein
VALHLPGALQAGLLTFLAAYTESRIDSSAVSTGFHSKNGLDGFARRCYAYRHIGTAAEGLPCCFPGEYNDEDV